MDHKAIMRTMLKRDNDNSTGDDNLADLLLESRPSKRRRAGLKTKKKDRSEIKRRRKQRAGAR